MEYANLNLLDFHLGVIDGGIGGEGAPGGRIVCFNGTGNEPLFMVTIDPTFAACAPVFGPLIPSVPVIPQLPRDFPLAPVPEPMSALMLLAGLGLLGLRRRVL